MQRATDIHLRQGRLADTVFAPHVAFMGMMRLLYWPAVVKYLTSNGVCSLAYMNVLLA